MAGRPDGPSTSSGQAHIPDRGEQMVRYYGWYSNKSRGIRKKAAQVGTEAPLLVLLLAPSTGPYRRHWAQLIQKVYEVDPLRLAQDRLWFAPSVRGR